MVSITLATGSFHAVAQTKPAAPPAALTTPKTTAAAAPSRPAIAGMTGELVVVSSGWQLQDVAKVTQAGAEVSSPEFKTEGWYAATVPGTVLTSLVNDGIYPEPLYG